MNGRASFSSAGQERKIILSQFEKLAREEDLWDETTPAVAESELDEGIALFKANKLEQALERFAWVIKVSRFTTFTPAQDRRIEARALGNYATVNHKLHRYEEAIFSYRMSCWIFAKVKDKQMVREEG